LKEAREGLAGRYFRDRVSAEERTAFLEMLRALAVVAPDPVDPLPVLRDRAADYLVALAGAAGAEAIVTGYRDLLEHEGLEPPALSARQACARFGVADA
jgi:predicted nucleic acid-binding protein